MLPIVRHPGRCIYCAFRARQYSLQVRRLPKGKSERGREHDGPPGPKIRYEGTGRGGKYDEKKNYLGKAEKDGVVRKFYQGNFNDRSPGEYARDFQKTLRERLEALRDEMKETPLMEQLAKESEADGKRPRRFEQVWAEFERKLLDSTRERVPYFGEDMDNKPVLQDLRDALKQRKEKGLDARIKYHFYGHVTGARFTKSDIRNQQAVADLRYPTEWFPATRTMHRAVHLHVGPTNSGKTYHALQRLEKADSGVYAGPLRLLAHEVYTRLNAKGKACSLITGEERRAAGDDGDTMGSLSSCTVEMMPLNTTVDVAVIDEIQMLGNRERGWAWTQALLGVKAREVHLCGEERTVPLVRELCASVGDKLHIHKYERLSPLEMAEESLGGNLNDLRKGDCIVSFSVMGIHALRKQIERKTGRKVATVYGSLPPETRAQQARLFNDPNNEYDFLVASDAVGMGLNLAIKRIIFEASAKFDGVSQRTLGIADIKQIAGRAGRYRTAAQATEKSPSQEDLAAAKGESAPTSTSTNKDNIGIVTTLEKFDFPIVQAAMSSDPEPIKTAGIFPPAPVLERFASYFPAGTPFSYILTRLHELSQMHSRFHLCGLKDQVWVADLIEPVKGLTVGDRNVICSSPASMSDMELWSELMPAYARIIAEQSGGSIVEIKELPLEVLEAEVDASRDYLRKLERLHKGIVGYLWLSYRFAGIFGTRALAFHVKGLVEEKIEAVLGKFSFSEAERRKIARSREEGILRDLAKVTEVGNGDVEDEEGITDETFEDVAGSRVEEGERQLDEQTTLTSGGDHLSGEEDVVLRDPIIEAEVAQEEVTPEESDPKTTSFAEWRRTQARGESQGSQDLPEDSLIGAALEGEAAALEGQVDVASEDRPAVADVEPEAVAADLDPELLTPEIELNERPLSTQEVAPEPVEPRTMDEEDGYPGGQNQTGGMPVKHLAQLDVDVGELERGEGGRP